MFMKKFELSGATVIAIGFFSPIVQASLSISSVPSGAVVVNLTREIDYSSYLAPFSPGTPPQQVYIKVDTGSPTYSFVNPSNKYCQQANQPCAQYGTYNNLTSTTARYESGYYFDELIDYGSGNFVNDTVAIGGQTIKNLQFGYIDTYAFLSQVPSPDTSICGLSLRCGNNKFDESCYYAGPALLPQLYNSSVINRHAVSFYLGPEEPQVSNSQMILGGAYDKAKIGGTPFTVPMTILNFATNAVNVTAISAVAKNSTARAVFGPVGVGDTALVDTGDPSWALPDNIFNIVYSAFGKPAQMSQETGAYSVDCKYRNLTNEYIVTEFGSYGKISVPFSSLVTSYGNETCVSFIANGGPASNGASTLADPFLRNVYVTFDQDNFTITFAQAKFTNEQEIVPLPQGDF